MRIIVRLAILVLMFRKGGGLFIYQIFGGLLLVVFKRSGEVGAFGCLLCGDEL